MLRRKLLLAFLVLLALSHAWRGCRLPDEGPAKPGQELLTVAEVDGETLTGREIRIAYREWSDPTLEDAPVVVLLHGSPGSSNQVFGVAQLLRQGHR